MLIDLLPLVDRELPGRRRSPGDAGVVDQDIDWAEAVVGCQEGGLPGIARRDIERVGRAHVAQLGGGRIGCQFVDVRDQHVRAFAGEAIGNRLPDPAR